MARHGSPNVVDCHELFRIVSKPVQVFTSGNDVLDDARARRLTISAIGLRYFRADCSCSRWSQPARIREADSSDDDRDRENGVGRRHGALAGIPIVLEDNVDTRDMPTTAGSLGPRGTVARTGAFITRKLRDARVPNRENG
jgi:Asp-tRNA(Asn)/Glu-tRNA(Gln) amidotransferase A subunit family amidase